MRWLPVTERPNDPTPSEYDGLPFILTPAERTRASVHSIDVERARRLRNQRDEDAARKRAARLAERALLDWVPDPAA